MGRAADGVVFVIDQPPQGEARLFVSDGMTLKRQPVAGAGSGVAARRRHVRDRELGLGRRGARRRDRHGRRRHRHDGRRPRRPRDEDLHDRHAGRDAHRARRRRARELHAAEPARHDRRRVPGDARRRPHDGRHAPRGRLVVRRLPPSSCRRRRRRRCWSARSSTSGAAASRTSPSTSTGRRPWRTSPTPRARPLDAHDRRDTFDLAVMPPGTRPTGLTFLCF